MIASGIPEIDDSLHGGLGGGLIVDIFGPPASGKSQLVFQICANAIAGDHAVLFLDTKGEFRPERVLDILGPGGGGEGKLEGISVLRATNVAEQFSGTTRIGPGVSLVVIDDITGLFSFEYGRDRQALEKNKAFMRYMRGLAGAALRWGVPVVATNTVRIIDGTEVESLGPAIDMFTHVKIRLAGNGGSIGGRLSTIDADLAFSFPIPGRRAP